MLPSFDIHFTTQTIKEIEDRAKKGIFGLLSEMAGQEDGAINLKLSTICLIIEKAARVSEEETNKLIDDYIAEGGDMATLMKWVFEKLTNSGFLGKPQKESPKEEAQK